MMEMTVLLLLYIPVTTALELRHSKRLQTDAVSLINSRLTTHNGRFITPTTTGTAHHQPSTPTLLNILTMKVRSRRAGEKGCKFGTCQVHNLANTLYMMGQSNGKEQSKKSRDPTGYGR